MKTKRLRAVVLGGNERDRAAPAVLDAMVKSSRVEIIVVVGEGRISCWPTSRKRARKPRFGQPSACTFADVTEEEEQRITEIGCQGGDPRNFRFGFVVVFNRSENFGRWSRTGGSRRRVERG